MPRAVVLLVAARALVLADRVGIVLVEREDAGNAGLVAPGHAESVDEERGLGLRRERRLAPQPREILGGLRVDRVGVGIRPVRQVDLGARDVEKGEGIAGREPPRLLRRDDVVGNRRDVGDFLGGRAKSAERTERGHCRTRILSSLAGLIRGGRRS